MTSMNPIKYRKARNIYPTYCFFFCCAGAALKLVCTVAPMLAIMAFAVSALGPLGARSRYFWNASAVPGGAYGLAVIDGGFPDQREAVLEIGFGVIRIQIDGLLEGGGGGLQVAGVDVDGAQVEVVFAGVGGIDLRGLGQLAPALRRTSSAAPSTRA